MNAEGLLSIFYDWAVFLTAQASRARARRRPKAAVEEAAVTELETPFRIFDDPYFYVAVLVVVVIATIMLVRWWKRRGLREDGTTYDEGFEESLSTKGAPSLKQMRKARVRITTQPTGTEKKAFADTQPKAEVKITEKTRDQITGIITKVKSLDQLKEEALSSDESLRKSEEERTKLEGSGVMDALAHMLVSNISTEEASEGRFSKMSIDGLLVFEDEEIATDPGAGPSPSKKQTDPNEGDE